MRPHFVCVGAVVAVLAVSLGGGAAAGTPARTVTAENGLESQIVDGLNAERRARGLVPLRLSQPLQKVADAQTLAMATYGFFAHDSRQSLDLWQRVARYARGRWAVGENLYWSSPTLRARAAVVAWMHSGVHRENVLRPMFREVGLSVVSVQHAPGVFGGRRAVIVTATFGVRY